MTDDLQQARIEAAVHTAWAKAREFRGVGGQAEFAPPWEFQQVIRAALAAADAHLPTVEQIADEIAGHPIGSGYYQTTVGVDEARGIAEDVRALFRGEVAGDDR